MVYGFRFQSLTEGKSRQEFKQLIRSYPQSGAERMVSWLPSLCAVQDPAHETVGVFSHFS